MNTRWWNTVVVVFCYYFSLTSEPGSSAPVTLTGPGNLKFSKFFEAGKSSGEDLSLLKGAETLECEACKAFSGLLEEFLLKERPEELVEDLIKAICIWKKIEDKNVCDMIVMEFKDEVLTVAYAITLGRAKLLCAILLGPSCQSSYNPENQTLWKIDIPGDKPPVKPIPDPKSGAPTNRILHISDLHWDQNYTVGLSKQCGEPICCRPPNKPETGSLAAGKYGEDLCDLPNTTMQNLFHFLSGIQDQFDWIYVTGDLPAHNVWNQTRSDQLFILKTIAYYMKLYFPTKKTYFTFGNHESAPVNSFPPPWVQGDQSLEWLYNGAADAWGDWLSEESIKNVKRGGFFNEKIRDGLRVISIQTNYANNENFWLFINDTDPAGQLSWLVEQLLEAEKAGDRVHLIGHIMPYQFTHSFGWNYHRIVDRFESTIAGQFYGHAHQDIFNINFDEDDLSRANSIVYIAPSITTDHSNLGFRIYTLDGDYSGSTNVVLDYTSYYFNVTKANLFDDPEWVFEYSAKQAYSLSRLLPSDWAELVDRFHTDDALFQKYYYYRYKMRPPMASCEGKCKAGILCDMVTTVIGDTRKCSKLVTDEISMADIRREMERSRSTC